MDELDEIRKKKMEKMMSEMNKSPGTIGAVSEQAHSDHRRHCRFSGQPVPRSLSWTAGRSGADPVECSGPIIEELARDFSGKIVFGKLNVEENMQTSNKHNISAIPTMLVFKNGKLVDKLVGAYPKATLTAKIQKYL